VCGMCVCMYVCGMCVYVSMFLYVCGVAVRPSRRTEGCSEEACCSFDAGPVVALAPGDGERLGGLPIGAV